MGVWVWGLEFLAFKGVSSCRRFRIESRSFGINGLIKVSLFKGVQGLGLDFSNFGA